MTWSVTAEDHIKHSLRSKKTHEEIAKDPARYKDFCQKISEANSGENHPQAAIVLQIYPDTHKVKKEWPYLKKAALELDLNPDLIGLCCRGIQEEHGDFCWEFKYKRVKKNKTSGKNRNGNNYNSNTILKLELGTRKVLEEFSSAKEASEETGVPKSCISEVANPNNPRKTAGGFGWEKKSPRSPRRMKRRKCERV